MHRALRWRCRVRRSWTTHARDDRSPGRSECRDRCGPAGVVAAPNGAEHDRQSLLPCGLSSSTLLLIPWCSRSRAAIVPAAAREASRGAVALIAARLVRGGLGCLWSQGSPPPGAATLSMVPLSARSAAPMCWSATSTSCRCLPYGIAYAKAGPPGARVLDGEESKPAGKLFPEAFLSNAAYVPGAGTLVAGPRCGVPGEVRRWCIARSRTVATLAVASRFNIGHRHLAQCIVPVAAAPRGGASTASDADRRRRAAPSWGVSCARESRTFRTSTFGR